MKRYGDLYKYIVDLDNIKLAHKNAKKGKRHYKEVKMVDKDIDFYCNKIQQILVNKTFISSKYDMFIKNDKGKSREIYKLPYYPDRIIQHAILQVLEPIWKNTLINDTFQSIKGRGVHKCMKKIKKVVYEEEINYCLQIDVKKFYPSIDNNLLKQTIRKKVKCKDTLWLLDSIIDGHKGVPIGNYISQYFGNLFLSNIDHIMKEKYGVKSYYRYCDDIIIIDSNKSLLHWLKEIIKEELDKIKLKIKENMQVYKITRLRPVDCLGFKIYKGDVSTRDRIVNNLKLIDRVEQLAGYKGWFKLTTKQNDIYNKYARKVQYESRK
jgi:RNA-directed DNA polymerase